MPDDALRDRTGTAESARQSQLYRSLAARADIDVATISDESGSKMADGNFAKRRIVRHQKARVWCNTPLRLPGRTGDLVLAAVLGAASWTLRWPAGAEHRSPSRIRVRVTAPAYLRFVRMNMPPVAQPTPIALSWVVVLAVAGVERGMVGPFSTEDEAGAWAVDAVAGEVRWTWRCEPVVSPAALPEAESAVTRRPPRPPALTVVV